MNITLWVTIAICAVVGIANIVTFATLIPKDSAQNSKILAIVTAFSFVVSGIAYALALYNFSNNPNNLIFFMLGLMMLVILPASLISVSISSVAVSNLRDTLAAAQ